MADVLWDLLHPIDATEKPDPNDLKYLESLAGQSLASLTDSEPQSQAQNLHTLHLSLQSACKRSHKAIVNSADRHSSLSHHLAALAENTADLDAAIPAVDHATLRFSSAFAKTAGDSTSPLLQRRRKALLLSRNCERIVDVMGLPTLLEAASSSSTTATAATNSSSALDLNAHVARLHALYPDSALVSSVSSDARSAMHAMASSLIVTLRQKNLKLAAAVRAVSWLRRILPELGASEADGEQCLTSLFLACRVATLLAMLSDLEPLRLLAEREMGSESAGNHTERYLKRYIEIFREQSFGILSMLKNLFPSAVSPPTGEKEAADHLLRPLVSPMSTFSLHLVDVLVETLTRYLGSVKSQTLYDGLVTQVMYCAASLGRLGGDFGIVLGCLGPDGSVGKEGGEGGGGKWVESIKRHRALTNRIESMVGDSHRDGRPVSSSGNRGGQR